MKCHDKQWLYDREEETTQWECDSRDYLWGDASIREAIHRSQNILFANRSKWKRHKKAVKQYLTRKEWKKGEQSCSLEELQKKTHRTKKGLRERKKKREAKEHLGNGKKISQHSYFVVYHHKETVTSKLESQASLSPTSPLSPFLNKGQARFLDFDRH